MTSNPDELTPEERLAKGEPVPIRDVAHLPEVSDLISKVEKGEINFCACLGPVYGEPYCSCEMQRRGLPLNEEARAKDQQALKESISAFLAKTKDQRGLKWD